MDKSKEYILMCQRSKEIQQCWQYQTGDFYADDSGSVNCWVPGVIGAPAIKNGFGIESDNNLIRLTKYTWLPRYNQLIEIAQNPAEPYRDMTFTFFRWSGEHYGTTGNPCKKLFPSLEQSWLAFVMEKNFQKLWTDEHWVQLPK